MASSLNVQETFQGHQFCTNTAPAVRTQTQRIQRHVNDAHPTIEKLREVRSRTNGRQEQQHDGKPSTTRGPQTCHPGRPHFTLDFPFTHKTGEGKIKTTLWKAGGFHCPPGGRGSDLLLPGAPFAWSDGWAWVARWIRAWVILLHPNSGFAHRNVGQCRGIPSGLTAS